MAEDLYKMFCPHCNKRLYYNVQLVSAVEVLRAKKGILGLGGGNPVMGHDRVSERYKNREILTSFINEMGAKGWEFCGNILYDGIPYNGAMVFRRAVFGTELEQTEVVEEVKDVAPEPEEKMHTLLKKNREKRESRPEHTIPKPRVKSVSVDESDKESLRKQFEDSLKSKKNALMPNNISDKFKEIEDEAMIRAYEKEKEQEEIEGKKPKPEKQPIKEISVDLYGEYENSHPGKHAVYHGKETRQFQKWRSLYLQELASDATQETE